MLKVSTIFRFTLENKNISHNQGLGIFTVLDISGIPHAVPLFATESCSCPSTTKCCHIIAVKMRFGLMDPDGNMKLNLTQVRRNTWWRKTGRKIPKVDDYDVIAAPDSMDVHKDQFTQNFICHSRIHLKTNFEAS
uniref:SWIM-type domain-containing protein n=1 Tax=Amphimedon queenslandica TaxID=400682 RepID=A0A1X7UTF2_AMPQE